MTRGARWSLAILGVLVAGCVGLTQVDDPTDADDPRGAAPAALVGPARTRPTTAPPARRATPRATHRTHATHHPAVRPRPAAPHRTTPAATRPPTVRVYANCTQLRGAYPGGVSAGHPAYRRALDRDHDGHACE